MNKRAVASALVGAGAVILQGCGGGGSSGGGSWDGFALVSQDFTLKETTITMEGEGTGTVNGNLFMGFNEYVGFGANFGGTKAVTTLDGEVKSEWGVWFMYDLTEQKAHMCKFDTEMEDGAKMCYRAKVDDKITKETFDKCINAEAKKLTVTDDAGLHKVDMVPAAAKEAMKKDETLANAGAYLYVDDSNMIKKIVFEITAGLSYTVEGDSKAVTADSFKTPATFTEAFAQSKDKEDIPISFKMLPAETPLLPLLECMGFAPNQDGKPDTPPATITV